MGLGKFLKRAARFGKRLFRGDYNHRIGKFAAKVGRLASNRYVQSAAGVLGGFLGGGAPGAAAATAALQGVHQLSDAVQESLAPMSSGQQKTLQKSFGELKSNPKAASGAKKVVAAANQFGLLSDHKKDESKHMKMDLGAGPDGSRTMKRKAGSMPQDSVKRTRVSQPGGGKGAMNGIRNTIDAANGRSNSRSAADKVAELQTPA